MIVGGTIHPLRTASASIASEIDRLRLTCGGQSQEVTAKEGLLGTPLGAKRSHLHAVLGEGDNSLKFQGNSQRNIALIESRSGHKDVNLSLGGGNDKVVVHIQDSPTGTIFIDGGRGTTNSKSTSRRPRAINSPMPTIRPSVPILRN